MVPGYNSTMNCFPVLPPFWLSASYLSIRMIKCVDVEVSAWIQISSTGFTSVPSSLFVSSSIKYYAFIPLEILHISYQVQVFYHFIPV